MPTTTALAKDGAFIYTASIKNARQDRIYPDRIDANYNVCIFLQL